MRHATLLALLAHSAMAGPLDTFDHTRWDRLLKTYVNAEHRFDYARLKKDGSGELDTYLNALAAKWPAGLPKAARKAALINAYNALVVRWILVHHPVASVWKTNKPFDKQRHTLDGAITSLDAIETELRAEGDPRIHAALVCAARSCPPLRREAYVPAMLDQQLDANTREWLADRRLNTFDAARAQASVSSIFKWYRTDFDAKSERLETFLMRFGPPEAGFLREGGKIVFLDYDWTLNDAAGVNQRYSSFSFYLDYFRNKAGL